MHGQRNCDCKILAEKLLEEKNKIDPGIQGVTGGTDQTSGECFLGHTIPI